MGASLFVAAAITMAVPLAPAQTPQPKAPAPAAVAVAPVPPDAEIERFLREASVVKTKNAGKGVTNSVHATLSDGKLTHDAHIQTIDEAKREFRSATGVEFDFRDSWTYNVAAYRLDRLLGLGMVPVSVSRKHRGAPAAWTWWIDDVLMDEMDKVKKKIDAPDSGYYSRQRVMMYLFDELISNTDRNQGNIVYTKDWRFWLIDHTRAFRKNTALKTPARLTRCERQVFERLKALDRDTLKREIGKELDDGQIKALLARRDAIVTKLESLGPTALFDRVRPALTHPGSNATVH